VIALIVRLLRLASFAICVIVIASFVVFAVDQTKTASTHQQEQLASGSPATTAGANAPNAAGGTTRAHESGVRKVIDEASSKLTSPFSGIVSGISGEWALRGTRLLIALLVYGFGLAYLARMLGVRA
jgi:hypothetical protein